MIITLLYSLRALHGGLDILLFLSVPLIIIFLPLILAITSKRMSVRIISLTFFLTLIIFVSSFIFLERKYNPQSTIAIHYIPLFNERDKVVNLFESDCKHIGKTDYLNDRQQVENFKCTKKLHESFIQFCRARAYTDRCPWRKTYLLINKIFGENLFITGKGDCAVRRKNTTFDPEYFSTEQVIYQEGCNDYYYLKYTPIKTGTTTIKYKDENFENNWNITIK